jgi:hypothetical protein
MKNRFLCFFSLLLLFLTACNETSQTVISLSDDFSAIGSGEMVATIEGSGDNLKLSGNLELNDDVIFTIYLSDPNQDTIFSKVYSQYGKYKIKEEFERKVGEWVFSYTIEKVEKITPSGTFDFNITYSDL